MNARLPVIASLAAIVLATSAACGRESGPTEIPEADLPFSLGRTPEVSPSPAEDESFTIFFALEGKLAPVTREAPSDLTPEEATMRALLEGPTTDELARGITSEIPPQTSLLEVRVLNLVADVDLSTEFQGPASHDAILLRVAQVVWTLVRLPAITAVRFVIDGEPVSVVIDDGTAVDRPVTAPDYSAIAPTEAP
ncbi:MAG: GerMN domain-containing protein [Actinomycetota bacterium]